MATTYQQFIQQNPAYAGNPNTANQTKSKKGSGNKSWLSSLISEAGGAGGAAGGAATGAAIGSVVPGIGTVIGGVVGAGLGGFLGGTGGRLAENKIRDKEYRLGDALKEGVLSGALSAGGAGFQALKGARGATALASELGDDVTKSAIKTAPKTGLLEQKGLNLTSKSGGYFTGATVPGSQPLAPSKVKQYDALLRKLKIPANDAADLARGIETRLQQIGGVLDDTVTKNNISLKPREAKELAADITKRITDAPGLGKEARKFAVEESRKIGQIKDAKGLLDYRKALDKGISFVANPDAALSDKQGAARIIREALKDRTDAILPGLKQQNGLYHELSNINDYVLKTANRGGTQVTNGGGLFGTIASSPTANTAKAKAGNALQSVGRLTAGTGGPVSQVTNQAIRQAPGNLLEAGMGQAPEQMQDTSLQGYDQMTQGTQPQPGMGPTQRPQQPQSQYSLQQAIADIQRDPANQADYMKFYEFVNQDSGMKQTAQQQKAAQQANTAMQGLSQLKSLYSSAGGGQGRVQGIVGNVLGKGGANSKANSYNQIRNSLTTTLARAFGETGVLTDQDREVYLQALPRLEDNPEEAAAKLQYLEEMLASSQQGLGGALNQYQGY